MKAHTFTFEAFHPDTEESLTVTASYTPGSPMVWYYKDGSGHPGDPDEVEILKVVDKSGVEHEWESFPQDWQERLEETALEKGGESLGDSCSDCDDCDDEPLEDRMERVEYYHNER